LSASQVEKDAEINKTLKSGGSDVEKGLSSPSGSGSVSGSVGKKSSPDRSEKTDDPYEEAPKAPRKRSFEEEANHETIEAAPSPKLPPLRETTPPPIQETTTTTSSTPTKETHEPQRRNSVIEANTQNFTNTNETPNTNPNPNLTPNKEFTQPEQTVPPPTSAPPYTGYKPPTPKFPLQKTDYSPQGVSSPVAGGPAVPLLSAHSNPSVNPAVNTGYHSSHPPSQQPMAAPVNPMLHSIPVVPPSLPTVSAPSTNPAPSAISTSSLFTQPPDRVQPPPPPPTHHPTIPTQVKPQPTLTTSHHRPQPHPRPPQASPYNPNLNLGKPAQFENARGPYSGFGHSSHLSTLAGLNPHTGLNPPSNYPNPSQQQPKGLDPNLAKHFPIHNLTGPTKGQPKDNRLGSHPVGAPGARFPGYPGMADYMSGFPTGIPTGQHHSFTQQMTQEAMTHPFGYPDILGHNTVTGIVIIIT
jgi:hypothetical protein